MKDNNRLCWLCKFFDFHSGSPGYSDMTPGTNFRMSCDKGCWEFEMGDSQEHFKKCLETANNCKDMEKK